MSAPRLERWAPEEWQLAPGWRPVVDAFLASQTGRQLADFIRGDVQLRQANLALGAFEAALALGNSLDEIQPLLQTIEGYNRDDCFSTLRLRDWLEAKHAFSETLEVFVAAGEGLAAAHRAGLVHRDGRLFQF